MAMRVGFMGLGNMGGRMASNLLTGGADLTVWNRTRSKAEGLRERGARVASSPAELAGSVDFIFSCMRDVEGSRDVFLGPDGVIANARPGMILVDHATVDPTTSFDCHAAATQKEARFLDAPVSGGHEGAEAGTLAIMAGGDSEAFNLVRPFFEMMGKNVRLMGPAGTGTYMKLINQLLVATHAVAAAEAFMLAESAGIDVLMAADVLMASWGGSTLLARNAPITRSRNFECSASPLRNLTKDLTIIREMTRSLRLNLPVSEQAAAVMHDADEAGYGGGDISSATVVLERRNDINTGSV